MEIIHIVLGKANPDRLNGVNKVVFQLATNQSLYHLDVSVWGITKDTSHNYPDRNFKTRLFKKSDNPFQLDPNLKKAILSKKGRAVFHIHGGWIPVFASLSAFLKKNTIEYVFTPHGAYNKIAMKKNSLVKRFYFKLFENRVINHAGKIHCIGKSEVEGLNSIFENEKSILLPYGFQLQEKVNNLQNTNNKMIIGFVGRIDIYTKGLDLLIQAFEQIHYQHPNTCLWILGDGPQRKTLEQMVLQAGIKDHVVFFGSKFGKEKDELIAQMTVFVHPSRNEGLPTAVLEAANQGVPCIVSEATNLAQYINEYNAGVSIKNESLIGLMVAMNQFYHMWRHKALSSMKDNARNMVSTAFDWNKLVFDFNALYS